MMISTSNDCSLVSYSHTTGCCSFGDSCSEWTHQDSPETVGGRSQCQPSEQGDDCECAVIMCISKNVRTPLCKSEMLIPFIHNTNMYRTVACNKSPVQHQCMDMMGLCIMLCIHCCTDHNQYHETFSCNKDSLCVFSSACSALNFGHIESVLIVFHTLTIFQRGFTVFQYTEL